MAFTKASVQDVLHPSKNQYINGAVYSREIGATAPDVAPDARCPFCLKLAMVPDWHQGRVQGFFHRHRGSSGTCPLVTTDVQPVGFQAESSSDLKAYSSHRDAFLEVWYHQYLAMKRQIGSLDIERFVRLVEHADILRLWAHPEFRLNDVPAVLLVLSDLLADTSDAKKPVWVRFRFAGLASSLDDLWRRKKTPALFKLSYKPRPDGRLPNYKELTDCTRVIIDWRSVPGAYGGPSQMESTAFEAAFSTAGKAEAL